MGWIDLLKARRKITVREVYPDIGGSSLELLPIGNIAPVSYQTLRSLEGKDKYDAPHCDLRYAWSSQQD